MLTFTYTLAGVPLTFEFRLGEADLAAYVEDMWSRIFVLGPAGGSGGIHITHVTAAAPPAGALLFESNGLAALHTPRGYQIRCGPCWMDLDLAEARGAAHFGADLRQRSPHQQRGLFQLAFLLSMGKFGSFALHAAALSREGRGLLAFGDSGAGKTNLALSLLRQGWQCVSDDAVLLRRTGGVVEAHAFGRGFSCTEETLARYPELQPLWPLREGKMLAGIEGSFRHLLSRLCVPAVVALCQVAPAARTAVEPLDAAQTIAALLRQSPTTLADRAAVSDQLEVLRELCGQTRAIRLLLGRDVWEEPRRFCHRLEIELSR